MTSGKLSSKENKSVSVVPRKRDVYSFSDEMRPARKGFLVTGGDKRKFVLTFLNRCYFKECNVIHIRVALILYTRSRARARSGHRQTDVHKYVCTHTPPYTHTYTCSHTHTHTHTHKERERFIVSLLHTCPTHHRHTNTRMHINTHAHTHTQVHCGDNEVVYG